MFGWFAVKAKANLYTVTFAPASMTSVEDADGDYVALLPSFD
jgi:hypothetical protein